MKIIKYFIIGILIFSSFTSISIGKESSIKELSLNIQFSEPAIIEGQEYLSLNIKNANTCLNNPDKPILPMYNKKLTFSFGTKIKNVECELSEIKSMALKTKIKLAPQPAIPDEQTTSKNNYIDETIYHPEELFPDDWISYSVGTGLDEFKNHKVFLTIQVFPVRYIPAKDKIYYVESFNLTITYDESENNIFPVNSIYNLLIISTSKFSKNLEKLVAHKNSYGINTILVSLDEIYNEDFFPNEGRDNPEKIKYFIKDAIEQWGIEYVLLVGGRIPGLKEKWHFHQSS